MTSRARSGLVWCGILVVALVFRPPIIAIGPMMPAIQADLSLSYALSGALILIPVLLMGVLSPVSVRLMVRWPPGTIMGACLVAIAVLSVIRNLAPTVPLLLVLTGVLGVALAIGNAVLPVATSVWYPGSAMFGSGAFSTGLNVGGAVAGAGAAYLAQLLGSWRWALTCIALISVPALLVWVLLQRTAPHHVVYSPGVRLAAAPAPRPAPVSILYVAFALNCALAYGMSAWLPSLYADRGWPAATAGGLVGLYNAASLIGGLSVMVSSRRFPLLSAAIAGLSLAVGVTMILSAHPTALLWVAIAGFGNGMSFTWLMAQPREVAGSRRSFESVNGVMLLFGFGVAAFTPLLLGYLRDATGNFQLAFASMAGSASLLAALLLCWAICRRPA